MNDYISREAIIKELEEEIEWGDEFDEKDALINKGLKIAIKDIKRQPAADVQPIDFVQNEVLNYLINKEREAESMPYSDVRQERIATLREVIRYVEGIGDTNG